ncbi:hypothetical protein [Luteimonas notoginsengisoli]|uniref:DUF2884 family protein n=1 Tax=Luteimonas notoginsengisoli TaxID=1578200 RepID=A0ABV7UT48_9GAMM
MPVATRPLFAAIPALFAAATIAPVAAQSTMADPGAMFDGTMAVARLSDAEASCEQLYAEATHLERTVAAMPKPEDPATLAMKMQADMREAQHRMVAGQRARSLGTSLLSLVPGGGMVAGAVSSLGSRGAGTAALDKTIEESMRAQQDSVAAMMAMSRLQARQGYVTQLFVERGCKPSQLDAAAVAVAAAALGDSGAVAIEHSTTAKPAGDAQGAARLDGQVREAVVSQTRLPAGTREAEQTPSAPMVPDENGAGAASDTDAATDTPGAGDA